jgi:MFS family permease
VIRPTRKDTRVVVVTLVLATVSTIFPGFLIGALSVQVSEEFGVSEATYGWGLGTFFLAATAGSVVMGRLVQRIGPRNQISLAVCISASAQLVLASAARSFGLVVLLLGVCGFVNAANQTAVNLALTRAEIRRLGLAVAMKQSAMPSSSMLAGIAVPVLALTVGWRWAYVVGAGLALLAVIAVRAAIAPDEVPSRADSAALVSSSQALILAAVSGGFLAFSAGSLNAWVVGSGVDAGLSPGLAGLMLSLGAASGITLRLYGGLRADAMSQAPFRVAGFTALIGAVGMVVLGSRVPGVHVVATLVAFGGGWVWPVFTNYGVVRTNPSAAGHATGISQMGVYVGVFVAPLITGVVIEHSGYEAMWLMVAASTVIGSLIALRIADEF